jgi:beta-carotene hydroxylase
MRTAADHSTDQHLPTLSQLGGDLLRVTPLQLLTTLALPFVAMGCYVLFAWWPCWPLAVASVMMLSFVTYGSTSHDLVHGTLHLPRRLNDFMLSLIELLSLRSGTAYRLSHLTPSAPARR